MTRAQPFPSVITAIRTLSSGIARSSDRAQEQMKTAAENVSSPKLFLDVNTSPAVPAARQIITNMGIRSEPVGITALPALPAIFRIS